VRIDSPDLAARSDLNESSRANLEQIMDFIERLFGVSPDGGDGSLEAVYLVVLLVIVSAIVWHSGLLGFFRRRQ
jgi:hypothetical protein